MICVLANPCRPRQFSTLAQRVSRETATHSMQLYMPQAQQPTAGLPGGMRVLHQVQGVSARVTNGCSPWLHWHFRSLATTADCKEGAVRRVEPSNDDGGALGRDCDSPEHEGHASQLQRLEITTGTIMGYGCWRVRELSQISCVALKKTYPGTPEMVIKHTHGSQSRGFY